MSFVNNSQVQSTNDASTISKCSAAAKNYFKDDYIEYFCDKKKIRASLINLGYYTRSVIFFKLLENYINFLKNRGIFKFQIVSCGAGFDTSYWRLSEMKLLESESVFIEIDFSAVIKKKLDFISRSKVLKSFTTERVKTYGIYRIFGVDHTIYKLSQNYYLFGADLSHVNLIEALITKVPVDFNVPTLFLSECAITYMKESSSKQLLKWMAQSFANGAFMNYEQIHPDDGFGKVMLKHFEKLQSTLHSVEYYPDCDSHCIRFAEAGFESNLVASEWEAFVSLTDETERQIALNLEMFDEFEEFHSKCTHYVLAIGGNRIASKWMKSLPIVSFNRFNRPRQKFQLEQPFSGTLQICRHCSFRSRDGNIYLLGGCDERGRSPAVLKIDPNDNFNFKPLEATRRTDISRLDVVYGNASYFRLNEIDYCCLYGGRTAPDKISNAGAVLIFQMSNDKFSLRWTIDEGNPEPRYRSSTISMQIDEKKVNFWIFGGRSSTLSKTLPDLSRLEVTLTDEGSLIHGWKTYEKRGDLWPRNRMSHGAVACPEKSVFFVSCGLGTDTFDVLSDLWKWDCQTETWSEIRLRGSLLPRYGHTSHVIDGKLYLVGGVNTSAGCQPGVAVIDLRNFSVAEIILEVSNPEPFLLFNHTSEVVERRNKRMIVILGGGGNCFSFGTYLNRGFSFLSVD